MLIGKKDIQIIGILLLIQIIIIILSGNVFFDGTLWFVNLFSDKLLVFLLVPMQLFGSGIIEKYMIYPAIIRIGNRKNNMIERLKRHYLYSFLFWSVWFSVILSACVIMTKIVGEFSLIEYWGRFIKYFLGSIMLTHVLIIFKNSNNKLLSENAFIAAYVLLAMELLVVVPEIKIQTPLEVLFFFSWMIYGESLSYLMLIIFNVLLLGYIFKISIRKDII